MAFLGSKGALLVGAHGESKAAFLLPKMPILVQKTAIFGTLIQIFQHDSLARLHYKRQPIHHEEQIETLSVKQKYRDQFEKTLEVVQDQIKKGLAIADIVVLLNDRGFKTRTGRKWTYSNLQSELKKWTDLKY